MVDFLKGMAPVVSGSAVAFALSSDNLPLRISRFFVSLPIGYYGGPVVCGWVGMSTPVAMFFVGAFGWLLLSKIYDGIVAIDAASVAAVFVDRLKKFLGVT